MFFYGTQYTYTKQCLVYNGLFTSHLLLQSDMSLFTDSKFKKNYRNTSKTKRPQYNYTTGYCMCCLPKLVNPAEHACHISLIIIIIIIIINRQFLTRRNIEHCCPLQGRELSMCREIQCCFDMSITFKQMSLESVFVFA